MKKFVLLLLLITAIFFANFSGVSALSPTVSIEDQQATAPAVTREKEASMTAKIEYSLAYPGILPDNPLYFLKATRDRMVSFLINEPIKKAEFNLLTSDKRLGAARMLVDKNRDELAVTTLSKSNNYLHATITSLNEGMRMGKNHDAVLSNLKAAILKHKEVVVEIEKRIDDKFAGQTQKENKRLLEFEKLVNSISPN